METTIRKTSLRYVVPFSFSEEFLEICNRLSSFENTIAPCFYKERKPRFYIWEMTTPESKQEESDLYEYIRNEFFMDGTKLDNNKMGCAWSLKSKDTAQKGLIFDFLWYPEQPDAENRLCYHFSIQDVGLYVFRNGLGFLWYEIAFDKKLQLQAGELVDFQNAFQELNRNNTIWIKSNENAKVSIQLLKNEKYPLYITPFFIGNWITELISASMGNSVTFFAERKSSFVKCMSTQMEKMSKCGVASENYKKVIEENDTRLMVPDKAILFSYIAFQPDENREKCRITEEKRDLVYHLTNGYKDSYHYSPEISKNMMQPFEEVLWYATKEGVSYVVWPSLHSAIGKEDGNAEFFTGNFVSKVEEDYFHLFIRTLYQSYSLLLYAKQTQNKLSAKADEYEDSSVTSDNANALEKLYTDINLFLSKNMATSVSYIHHQSDFYIYLRDSFHIHDDVQCVTAGLSALDSLQRDIKEREERRREKEEDEKEAKRDNRFQAIMSILSALTGLSLLIDLRECFHPKIDLIEILILFVNKNFVYFILQLIFLVATICGIGYSLYLFSNPKMKRNEKKGMGKKRIFFARHGKKD